MQHHFLKPYFLFFVTGIGIFIRFILKDAAADVANHNVYTDTYLHDVYYILNGTSLGLIILGMCIFFSVIYYLIRKQSKNSFGLLHFMLSMPWILAITFTNLYYHEAAILFDILMLAFVLGQLIFIANMVLQVYYLLQSFKSSQKI
jgi:hypothetical protein